MPSPCMTELLAAAESWITALHVEHMRVHRHYGRGHDITVTAGRRVATAKTTLTELKDAVRRAEPESAQGSFDAAKLLVAEALAESTSYATNPSVKRSNARRRVA